MGERWTYETSDGDSGYLVRVTGLRGLTDWDSFWFGWSTCGVVIASGWWKVAHLVASIAWAATVRRKRSYRASVR